MAKLIHIVIFLTLIISAESDTTGALPKKRTSAVSIPRKMLETGCTEQPCSGEHGDFCLGKRCGDCHDSFCTEFY